MRCDMCGQDSRLFKTEVEGSVLNVCQTCAKHGKVVARVSDPKYVPKWQKKHEQRTRTIAKEEITETLIEGFGEIVKEAREKRSLKQEEIAKKIKEKESVIHKIETGSYEPNIKLARKLERFLHIKIVEETKLVGENTTKTKGTNSFTLGDFIKVK